MVAEIKKNRYIYYHCSRGKGKCPELYTRGKVLEERSAELLDQFRDDDEVLARVSQALRVSHEDEKHHHGEAIRQIQAEEAKQTCFDEGIRFLELAHKAEKQFRRQPAAEKRLLLGFVLSNCTWRDGQRTAAYRQPFYLIAKNVAGLKINMPAGEARTGAFDIWLPNVDTYRTSCPAPSREVRAVFGSVAK